MRKGDRKNTIHSIAKMTGRIRYHPFLFSRLHSVLLGDTEPLFLHPSQKWVPGVTNRRRTEVAKLRRTTVFSNPAPYRRKGTEIHCVNTSRPIPQTQEERPPHEVSLPQSQSVDTENKIDSASLSFSFHPLFVSWIRASSGYLLATLASTSQPSPNGLGTSEKAIARDRIGCITEATKERLLSNGRSSPSWLPLFWVSQSPSLFICFADG